MQYLQFKFDNFKSSATKNEKNLEAEDDVPVPSQKKQRVEHNDFRL